MVLRIWKEHVNISATQGALSSKIAFILKERRQIAERAGGEYFGTRELQINYRMYPSFM